MIKLFDTLVRVSPPQVSAIPTRTATWPAPIAPLFFGGLTCPSTAPATEAGAQLAPQPWRARPTRRKRLVARLTARRGFPVAVGDGVRTAIATSHILGVRCRRFVGHIHARHRPWHRQRHAHLCRHDTDHQCHTRTWHSIFQPDHRTLQTRRARHTESALDDRASPCHTGCPDIADLIGLEPCRGCGTFTHRITTSPTMTTAAETHKTNRRSLAGWPPRTRAHPKRIRESSPLEPHMRNPR